MTTPHSTWVASTGDVSTSAEGFARRQLKAPRRVKALAAGATLALSAHSAGTIGHPAAAVTATAQTGQIVFEKIIAERVNLFGTAPTGAGLVQLTNDPWNHNDPAWSPDGTKIAFAEQQGGEVRIVTMNSDGSDRTNLTPSSMVATQPEWSPDGTKIVFLGHDETSNRSQIYTIGIDGSGLTALTSYADEYSGPSNPDWSPDGSKIAFDFFQGGPGAGTGARVVVVDADGSNLADLNGAVSSSYQFPRWSPDGSKIAFAFNGRLSLMNSDGTQPMQLAPSPPPSSNGQIPFDTAPDWSPDGSMIVFASSRLNHPQSDLFTITADGQNLTPRTTDGNASHPVWQPATTADVTPPIVTGTVTSSPVGGWYRSPIVIEWTTSDDSGSATTPPPTTVNAEGALQTVQSEEACDPSGNCATGTVTALSIDGTPPTIEAGYVSASTHSTAEKFNGWYREAIIIDWYCTDTLSGVALCPSDTLVSTDGANQSFSATARDVAGNESTLSVTGINVDTSPPEVEVLRSCDTEYCTGSSLGVSISGTDPQSGVQRISWRVVPACNPYDTSVPYSHIFDDEVTVDVPLGASSGSQTLMFAVVNFAETNVPWTCLQLGYDNVAPLVTPRLDPLPNASGWNNTDVRLHWDATDVGSGVAQISPDLWFTEETVGTTVTGSATDAVGLTGSAFATVKLDKTPPTIEATVSGTTNTAGAYVGAATVTFTCTDMLSSVASCPSPITLSTPGSDQSVEATAVDVAGNRRPIVVTGINIASTAPVFTSPAVVNANARSPFSFSVTTVGSPVALIDVLGALPLGLTLTDNLDGTALISGAPATSAIGSHVVTLRASNGLDLAVQQALTINISSAASAPAFSSPSALVETFGMPFSFTITTTGYPAPTITRTGQLPRGVSFTDNRDGTATLSGTPAASAVGEYGVTFRARNSVGAATQTFTLAITRRPSITRVATKTVSVGRPITPIQIVAKGYETPTVVLSNRLPTGLVFLDNGDGSATISGTPEFGTGGRYSIAIEAFNSLGSGTTSFLIDVNEAPRFNLPPTIYLTLDSFDSLLVEATGYPKPRVTLSGTLPRGIRWNSSTRTLGGTPQPGTNGTYLVTFAAKNRNGSTSHTLELIVGPPLCPPLCDD